MILIIDICKEKLHYLEFVKPICDILDNNKIKYFVKDYKKITKKDLKGCSKFIICGTSLYDNEFVKNIKKFKWIMDFDKPILGICGGMQIIGLLFGGELKKKTEEGKNLLLKKTEIGFYKEVFNKNFLGLFGEVEVYHLHNNYLKFNNKMFEIYNGGNIAQAIKHKEKEIYGVLFHPEVRNKDLIMRFCSL